MRFEVGYERPRRSGLFVREVDVDNEEQARQNVLADWPKAKILWVEPKEAEDGTHDR